MLRTYCGSNGNCARARDFRLIPRWRHHVLLDFSNITDFPINNWKVFINLIIGLYANLLADWRFTSHGLGDLREFRCE